MIANLIKVKNFKKALNNDKVMTFALRFSYFYFLANLNMKLFI